MTVKLDWIKWRDGRPRLVNGPRERLLGFKDRDLRHPPHDRKGRPIGRWFSYEEAEKVSQEHAATVAAARAAPRKTVTGIVAAVTPKLRTIEHLLDDWMRSDEFKALRPSSIASYKKAVRAVLYKPESREQARQRRLAGIPETERMREQIAAATPSSVGAPELRAFFNYLREARGHTMALGAIAALSAAFTWGRESPSWRLGANPRLDMEFDRPDGRVVLIALPEFSAIVAAADALERPSIGDAQYLGLFTGQRLADRLAMKDEGLVAGRHHLRQSKTGMLVSIKEAPQLASRLAQARRRVAELKIARGLRELPQQIVIDEASGKPYNTNTYRHIFTDIRELATFGWLKRHTARQALDRAQRLAGEIVKAEAGLFASLPMRKDEWQHDLNARAARLRAWCEAEAARDSNGEIEAWKLAPCPGLLFVDERSGAADFKNDQDLRDTCVMLLDAAGNDVLAICDITGHSYQSAQLIMKHYRARNAARADVAIDRLVAFVSKEGLA
jgi:hypothetical protein